MNKLLERAKKISTEMQTSFWKLGKVLLEIKEYNIYEEMGYSSFKSFCEGELCCSLRTAQISVVLHKWRLSLGSDAASKWIESVPWSYTNVYYKLINSSNWKKWKIEYEKMDNGKKFYDVMVEYKQKLKRVNIARREGVDVDELYAFMDDINFVEDPFLYLEMIRLKDKDVSNVSGVNVGTIRNNTKYVRCILPIDVYLKVLKHAKASDITVEREISDALTILYRGEDKILSKVC